jgi:Sec-independent protein translocase protein TatA
VGLGTEVLFILAFGVLLLGPKRAVELLGRIARAKAQLELAARQLKNQLDAELEGHDEKQASPPYSNVAGEQ